MIDEVELALEQARLSSLTRDNPLLSSLPSWFTELRDHQRKAVREILLAYEEGVECVVVDAPTGAGKTLLAEVARRMLGERQTTYICSSKSLQDQFVRDYPYAKVLKGRGNYATELYPEQFGGRDGLSTADCTKTPGDPGSCQWCSNVSECPYERSKISALRADLAVLNTSYFLSECNGPGRFSRGGLVIADECDGLEHELMGHVEVRISERRLKQYGLGVPRYVTKEESWREWAEEAADTIRNCPPRRSTGDILLDTRARKRHDNLLQRVRELKAGLDTGNWVYTGDRTSVAFKPVTVAALGQEKLWQHGDKWLLMSATVISADELLESLGWDEERDWRLVKVPSTFPPENRKVVVWPVANMTYKTKEESWPKVTEAVIEIARQHPGDRILVHSTSYALTSRILQGFRALPAGASVSAQDPSSVSAPNHFPCHIPDCPECHLPSYQFPSPRSPYVENEGRPVFTYSAAFERGGALEDYLRYPASILIAPSLDRGIDLPGDKCRVQIICKVPFLSLTDKQVSARLYGGGRAGKTWYAVNAIRTIVQMTGRAVRSEEDWAVSYILDRQFVDNVWGMNKRLLPEWWRAGIEWRRVNGKV